MKSFWKTLRDRFSIFSGVLILSIAGFLLLLFGGVFPSAAKIRDTRAEISEMEARMKQRDALLPIYSTLKEPGEPLPGADLPVPLRTHLPLAELTVLPDRMERLAAEAGLQTLAATPQTRSLKIGEPLRMDIRARGEFHNMRDFLLHIAELPYLDRIEGLTIQSGEAAPEIGISLFLAIQ